MPYMERLKSLYRRAPPRELQGNPFLFTSRCVHTAGKLTGWYERHERVGAGREGVSTSSVVWHHCRRLTVTHLIHSCYTLKCEWTHAHTRCSETQRYNCSSDMMTAYHVCVCEMRFHEFWVQPCKALCQGVFVYLFFKHHCPLPLPPSLISPYYR